MAEVVYLNNGEVLIGTIKQTTSKGVVYETYKGDIELALGQILRTEPTLDNLKSIPVSIQLKDSSVLRGKVVDFDPEIGIFLDIAFGTLTIPLNGIDRILEMKQAVRYNGNPFQLSAGGGMYFPIGDSGTDFNPSWFGSTTFHLAIPGIRGLYGGIEASFLGADYTGNSTTDYYFIIITPELTYKYLGLRVREGFSSAFTPFVAISAGPCYIHIYDPNLYPSSYGDLALYLGSKLGTEITIKQFSIKLAGIAGTILQKKNPFTFIGASLQFGYEY